MSLSVWRRSLFVVVALAASLLAEAPSANAEKRVALVIGNGDYRKVGRLPNPARDASAVENMLRGAGFEAVEVKRDLGRDAMRRALRDFSDKVRDADIAVVFYAGHGIEVNGANYLIPVDAALERDIDVEDEAVPLDRVSQVLEQARRLRLVILDACRDNPFARSMRRTIGTRSVGRGLAKVEVLTSDTLIAFAAKAGSTAADGQGANSPYTSALVKHLATPGLDVRLAFGRVRDDVLKRTNSRQEPFVYGSLGGAEIALVPASGVAVAPAAPPSVAGDAVSVCREVEVMTNSALLGAMANQHKGTPAADCIAARLADLKQMEAATPAAQPSSAAADYVRICREVEGMANPTLLGVMANQHKGTPAADCIAARLNELPAVKAAKAAKVARAKADAERVCAYVQSIANVAVLKPMAGQHQGTPAEACIAARIDALKKQKPALGTPKALAPLTAAEERALKPKDSFKECDVCPEMVVVPAGSFTMGSPPGEQGRYDREGPQREVKVARPFAAGRFEVTFAEWDACVVEAGCSHRPDDARWGRGKQPVINVSWDHITQEYLPWLSRKTGKTYRLLTEAEWEYVARAGTATPFWWGSSISTSQANYSGGYTYGGGAEGERRWKTVPVDSFAANPWGFYNVHGNVWEWVQDCWNDNYNGAPSDESARTTADCGRPVMRGGGYMSNPNNLRSSYRDEATSRNAMSALGFRVGRTF